MSLMRPLAAGLWPLLLAACAATAPPAPAPSAEPAPVRWHAPLPHDGELTELARWWQQFDDPLLAQLIDAAQSASPTLASARSRVVQARAARTFAGAALLPAVDASTSASRGNQQQPDSIAITSVQALAQASWEIDLFGGLRASRDAADARLAGSQAQWHDARVSVAAEVALRYADFRYCERNLEVLQRDLASRLETSRLTGLAARAGFQPPAASALARASAAEASNRFTQQRAQCDRDVKALVALAALDEPALRERLVAAAATPFAAPPIAIAALPAQVLAQRPDLFNAAREVAAASSEIDTAEADRYPRLALGGSIGVARISGGGFTSEGSVWSVGPLTLAVPLFDGGRRAANVQAARARYEEAAAAYRARARGAVREVEETLVGLQSTAARADDARTAVDGFRESFVAAEARYKGGLASLFELEDARRSMLGAETAQLALERERLGAWIALYRAAGGGWTIPEQTEWAHR